MPRFFIDSAKILEDSVSLDARETRHAMTVFRLKKGDAMDLFDGKGSRYCGVAQEVVDGLLSVSIRKTQRVSFSSAVQVTLGVAVFRPERMEILIQKACELGAGAIVPFVSDRCIIKISSDRWEGKIKRWQKIIQESCKQCGLAYAPEISAPVTYKNFISNLNFFDVILIPTLECAAGSLAGALPRTVPRRILGLIGPEGDFSPDEVALAVKAGAKPVSLGPLVMRSETAGIYLLSAVNFFYREALGQSFLPGDKE